MTARTPPGIILVGWIPPTIESPMMRYFTLCADSVGGVVVVVSLADVAVSGSAADDVAEDVVVFRAVAEYIAVGAGADDVVADSAVAAADDVAAADAVAAANDVDATDAVAAVAANAVAADAVAADAAAATIDVVLIGSTAVIVGVAYAAGDAVAPNTVNVGDVGAAVVVDEDDSAINVGASSEVRRCECC